MKADLVHKEPEMLKFWEQNNTYEVMQEASGSKGKYIFHDGPPYANGHIHLGTALNKILKDIIIKSKNLSGYKTPYVPGWNYESVTAAELANFAENGNLNRSKKPIYWCNSCQTALAEAEVEYDDHTSPSVYVRFPLADEKLKDIFPNADTARSYIVIWTTTPWTLPDNLAVCLHPEFIYVLVEAGNAQYILAKELLENCAKIFGWEEYTVLAEAEGKRFENLKASHPFYKRESLVILGEHVTLDAGTGCVHTAPGHGREDYEVGLKYGLEAYSPLDDQGRFLPAVEFFAGMMVFDANPHVIAKLEEVGNLLAQAKISHSYPHCWRCKEPVIFRATTQWFITMDTNNLRQKALNAIRNDVKWIPSWGEDRIYNMIEQRPDWCISRQRTWGVPILALLCQDCGEAWQNPAWMREIAERFAKHPTGCDYWYEAQDSEIIPNGIKCPHCGGTHFKREKDILDVWFDSGTSFAAVMEKRPEGGFPADLYLEGSDQHRGWFHSSLLASVGTRGVAPYKNVLTHGYVVDGAGRKMSKSIGNVVAPQEVIDKHGAELLRLWVSSVDYREDIRFSDEIMSRLVDAYRRIRNTIRYMLGSIFDLGKENMAAVGEMESLDRFALDTVMQTHNKIQEAYENFEFHKVYHALHGLCATELSAFYFDILKDRLYSSHPESRERRSAQTALYHILNCDGFTLSEEARKNWEQLLLIRSEITKAIEPLRKSGEIGHSLDTAVELYLKEDLQNALKACNADLRAICIISQLKIEDIKNAPVDAVFADTDGIAITVTKAKGEKCERCWIYSEELGTDANHPTLCPRCTEVMKNLE